MINRVCRAMLAVLVILGAGCGLGGSNTSTDRGAIEQVVRAHFVAENERDVDTFLDLWTDAGLKDYDVGSREEIRSGSDGKFGENVSQIVRIDRTRISGDRASTLVATAAGGRAVMLLYRIKFDLVFRDGEWLLDGYEFVGRAPASRGTDVVNVFAEEYSFVFGAESIPRNVAFAFENVGSEQHEMVIFRGPDDLTSERVAVDLAEAGPDAVPPGYQADEVAFLQPGERIDIAFAKPLEGRRYVLACYIPQGGITDGVEPDPNAPSHFDLGMRTLLRVG